ncbi:Hypothetical_protein [Hexamita inflata]|uniref:Hypothetical_protein n=1 Tax=Hexamita inflata TaxID=28002 RepID=A0AA86Q0H9_9EUKA|nr:Hypothetical protein HINF_LOCUS35951 [Hexamita inflata]
MAHCSDSGVSAASDFVLSGHFLSTQQTLAIRVELFVQNLKSVFYQVEEFIIGQISEIVDGIANGRYSRVILKGVFYYYYFKIINHFRCYFLNNFSKNILQSSS